jgi:hypothetical protein
MVQIQAACHVHSSWSYDGSWSLENLALAFGRRGCRVVMMTEHDLGFSADRFAEYREACARATSEHVFVMPGIEYSDVDNRVHLLVWGVPFLGEGLKTEAVLDAAAHHGGVAVLAHPTRKAAWECFRPAWADRLLGIETWNRKYDGWAPSEKAADLLNGAQLVPFVGLDFHTKRQFFPLEMVLDLDVPVNEAAVLDCLRGRRCAARAFGLPLEARRFQMRLPVLQVAERGRRQLAAIKRYSKARLSR